jgi:dTDP-glucose 4,6-dehydratase
MISEIFKDASMRSFKTLLVTGGFGFIGSNFIRYIFSQPDFNGTVVNIDSVTYAGNPDNLNDINEMHGGKRYFFERKDITEMESIIEIMKKYDTDAIVHFAAESHVDRSIAGPGAFVRTNINGTYSLLEAARACWDDGKGHFHHVSTDEVYGSLGESGYFFENTPYDPRSPYSASKAASDHLVSAYHHTYGIPVTITNCSNNYGPYQFPEKLIPLMISNIKSEKPLPVYGDGKNIRDWLYVDDHNSAVWLVMKMGKSGETYNIGGENEIENIRLVNLLCEKIARIRGRHDDYYKKFITYVKDRPGHDRRYAINCDKIKNELGWKREYDFEHGIEKTILWYLNNDEWIENIKSGEYMKWIETHYGLGV